MALRSFAAAALLVVSNAVALPAAVLAQESPPLRLSEFSGDPAESGNDGAFEWVELHNVSEESVSLEGWAIGDSKTEDVLPAFDVPAGAYVLITGRSAVHPDGVLALRVPDGIIGSGLNNGGDVVRLIAPGGELVDAVAYGTERQAEADGPAAPPAGRSAAFDDALGRWRTALEPTPGRENAFPATGGPALGGDERDRPEVRFDAESGMSPAAWALLAAAGVAGIAGAGELAYRRWRR